MQRQRDLKELRKNKCSVKGCKNRADSLVEKKYYCDPCSKNLKNKDTRKDWISKIGKKNNFFTNK